MGDIPSFKWALFLSGFTLLFLSLAARLSRPLSVAELLGIGLMLWALTVALSLAEHVYWR